MIEPDAPRTTRRRFLAASAALAGAVTFPGSPAAAVSRDRFGALVVGPRTLARGRPDGALHGLTFVAKDLFDVAGHPTGAGCPEWSSTHATPDEHAVAVARALRGGARLVGKAVTDELAFSLTGTDSRAGTPRNPAAPDRIPGGSSSGSAVAVASELCDFALGTDTGGSIRVPAAYNGLVALRPTHGRISLRGAVPLAPSFDTVGVLARGPRVLRRAAHALLTGDRASGWSPSRLLVATDAFAASEPATAAALGRSVERVARELGARRDVTLAPGPDTLDVRNAAFRDLQGWEAWRAHGAWITRTAPALGPGVASRFAYASSVTEAQRAAAAAVRERVTAHLLDLLGDDGVVALPAAADPPPLRTAPAAEVDPLRARSLRLLCTAGLAGAPVVVLPAGKVGGGPIGLALIGPPGGDEALLALAAAAFH